VLSLSKDLIYMTKQPKSKQKKNTKSSPQQKNKTSLKLDLLTIVSLIFVPIIGLFLLSRKSLFWKPSVKTSLYILSALYIPVHAFIVLSILYAGSINHLLPNDLLAKQYLQNRYHQEFVVGESASSDQLGGPLTYRKWVSPENDSAIKFVIDKCLARCNHNESTEFTDSYPTKMWNRELTEHYTKELNLNKKQTITVYANADTELGFVDTKTGAIPQFSELTKEQKTKIKVSIFYKEKDGRYSAENRIEHAQRILAIVGLLRNSTATPNPAITYEISTNTPESIQERFKDVFNFNTEEALALNSPEDIYPLFEASTHGRGANKEGYNLRTLQINKSKGSTMGIYRPSPQDVSKAKLELSFESVLHAQISSRYVVTPYIIASVVPNKTLEPTLLYEDISPNDYTVAVAIYNYPNATLPISEQAHTENIHTMINILKQKFSSSSLTYKTDSMSCEMTAITITDTSPLRCV
jgi:hypothetical protein